MAKTLVDGFFYGLYMDADVLRELGVSPGNLRRAYVDDFSLHVGLRATLVHAPGKRAYGLLIGLSRGDYEKLYSASGLEDYRPVEVLAHSFDGEAVRALCYILKEIPESDEPDSEYAARLREVLEKLEFPAEYIASVS